MESYQKILKRLPFIYPGEIADHDAGFLRIDIRNWEGEPLQYSAYYSHLEPQLDIGRQIQAKLKQYARGPWESSLLKALQALENRVKRGER